MYIFLPNYGVSINTFVENLSSSNWNQWTNQFDFQKVYFSLPRFKLEYRIELQDILPFLGMGIAFRGEADFSGICPGPLSINEVKHKTFVEVNEEGTEAAAATAVLLVRGYRCSN